jgi:selenide,water dikinase
MMDRVEKEIVLLGAGNSHLQVVKWWGMDPIRGTSLTLVNDAARIPYSGMLPGCIAGAYTRDEVEIDVSRLCAVSGVRLIQARAERVAHEENRVILEGRPPLRYDLLSLNIGSQPAVPIGDEGPETLLLKPLCSLMNRMEALDRPARESDEPFPVVVVGGGAGGFEICLALRKRLIDCEQVSLTLLTSGANVLASAGGSVSVLGEKALSRNGVRLLTNARVTGGDAKSLQLENGETVECACCIWATQAEPTELIARSGFEADARGFLQAEDTLQSVTSPDVFATGDCVSLASYPDMPKAGIFAVREGPVLWENLRASIEGESLKPYRPQKLYLFLLNTSDGAAVVNYGPFAGQGNWAFRWKTFIDRRWMRKLHDSYAPGSMEEEEDMRCGGCGAKLGREVLDRVLDRLDTGSRPDVLSGVRPGDDAAVLETPPGKVQLQTTDFFKAFVEDPYLFGQIAANNAISDIFAMNGDPAVALALVTIPEASNTVREELLFQVLSGALETFKLHDVVLAGGHTTESMDFQVGFTVTGYADKDSLFTKGGLAVGDQLVLTKPLGTGSLLRAAGMGLCDASDWQAVIDGMLWSNREAAGAFARHGVRACTDVTGFGLVGHLLEMLDAGGVSAEIMASSVPLYPGFEEFAAPATGEPILSTLHEENARSGSRVRFEASSLPAWLFDPQTSGGLLAAVAPEKLDPVLAELKQVGCAPAAHVGEVVARGGEVSTIGLI